MAPPGGGSVSASSPIIYDPTCMQDADIDGTLTLLGNDAHYPGGISEGDAMAPAVASTRSCLTRLRLGDTEH